VAAGVLQEGDILGAIFGLLNIMLRPAATASLKVTAPGIE